MTPESWMTLAGLLLVVGGGWAQLSSRIARLETRHESDKLSADLQIAALRQEDLAIERRANDGLKQLLDHLQRIEDRLDRVLEGK